MAREKSKKHRGGEKIEIASRKKIEAEEKLEIATRVPEEVLKNAKRYSQASENEVIRVLLHAVLHVLGYDDKSKESRQEMRKQEDHFLAVFNKKHK